MSDAKTGRCAGCGELAGHPRHDHFLGDHMWIAPAERCCAWCEYDDAGRLISECNQCREIREMQAAPAAPEPVGSDTNNKKENHMKNITSHHDGYALNDSIVITAEGEPGPGAAHHLFVCRIDGNEVARIQFQEGPRNEPGSTPGVTHQAVLAILCDALADFQKGPFPSREGAIALTKMQEAMHWFRARADERASRNALGYAVK